MSDFEQWWNNNSLLTYPSNKKIVAQNAYEAGRKAGLEEAAEIADDMYDRNIAAAIRERMK